MKVRGFTFALLYVGMMVVMFKDWSPRKGPAVAVIGSNSVQPFAEILAEEFNHHQKEVEVEVQGGGSTVGLQATRDGIADIGMCSRKLKPEEQAEFNHVVIAEDGLAIVVHSSNPVDNLTVEQIRQMYSGAITNWKEVGGQDLKIRLIVREESSGTREAFMTMVMGHGVRVARSAISQDSNGAIKELVKNDRQSIGFISLGLVNDELKAVKVAGVTATFETVKSRQYPLVRPFLFLTKGPPNERAQKFIDFTLSEQGQSILAREGLVRVK